MIIFLMIKSKWYLHPIFIFILSLLAIGSSLTIYIRSYLKVSTAFANFMRQHNVEPELLLDASTGVNIFILSILCLLVIASIAFSFTYYRKVISLYNMQQNFINGFTHELKTPVTSLKLYLDTFSMHELDRDTQLKYIEYMKRDTSRLSDNISTILNLAKIEDKKYVVQRESLVLKNIIEDIILKNAHAFERSNINIICDSSVSFKGDRVLMTTLFMNLLINAVAYNHNETPEIEVRSNFSKSFFEISIKDNGIGLSRADLKKIFKKFYRVKKAVKGSGIGLYLSQQIVKLHKGNIKAYSDGVNNGTTFIISIPQVYDESKFR